MLKLLILEKLAIDDGREDVHGQEYPVGAFGKRNLALRYETSDVTRHLNSFLSL